jgi:hypothetical protein
MIRKDYILRMVQEFAKFLAKIIGLKMDGKLDEALKEIDNVYKGMIDLDPIVLKSLGPEEVLDFLLKEKKYNNHHIKMIAELLFEEGQIYVENGDPISARNVMEKAKILINYLMESDSTFSFDWYEKISVIDEVMSS